MCSPWRPTPHRYRGLKSWRTSTWHPKENLPPEYAKIYNFRNWAGFQAHALREQAAAAEAHPRSVAPAGSYVAITLRVPRAFGDRYGAIGGVDAEGTATHAAPLVLCGVHTYEAHLSVRSRLGATDCD
jgi:pre-rRNA-processing protein TSR1